MPRSPASRTWKSTIPRSRPVKHLALTLLVSLLAGCASIQPSGAGRIHHIVFCWLKEEGDIVQREKIMAAAKSFAQIPGVLEVHTGVSVESDRPIVDDSFDVAITMTFATVDDMNAYIVHPAHKDAVRDVLMPLVSRIKVYDFAE